MTEVELKNHVEVLVDIAYIAGEKGLFKDRDSRAVNKLIINWACEFARLHKDTDWNETDYLDVIYSFASDKIKEELNNND